MPRPEFINRKLHLIAEDLGRLARFRDSRFTYRDTFLGLADLGVYTRDFAEQIARSAGLRNILVHDYNDIDRRIVYGSIRTCLEQYHHMWNRWKRS